MNNKLIIILVAVLLIVVGLSVFFNSYNVEDNVNNENIEKVKIVNHSLNKMKKMVWYKTPCLYLMNETGYIKILRGLINKYSSQLVDFNLVLDDIDTNIDKRKNISLKYINSEGVIWNDIEIWGYKPYSIFVDKKYGNCSNWILKDYSDIINFTIIENIVSNDNAIWIFNGTAKNIGNKIIGDSLLNHVGIKVDFYDSNNTYLTSESSIYADSGISPGCSWDFSVEYDGKYSNDISYVKFEVTVGG